MPKPTYSVIVSNIGTVHSGKNEKKAWREYHAYVELSRTGKGRASGETITLLCDDAPGPLQEWIGGKTP